jgi:PAS domain S-box-containing protein
MVAVKAGIPDEDPTTRMWRERFEQAFHGNAAAMVIARQSDLRIIDVNPRWLELFAATREEVIGRTSVELGLITPGDADVRIAQHRQFVDGYDVELALRTRAGRAIIVLASAKPIVISEGPCTLTTLIDITERKQAEAAFAAAFSASPAGMMLVDAASDRVVSVNRRMRDLTQCGASELIGWLVSELDFIRRPTRAELLAQVTRDGKLESVEVLIAGKGGTDVWTLLSVELVTLHGVPHRLSVFTDIDDRKRAEQAVRELNADLERRVAERTAALQTTNRDLEAFTSTVSHDLRAPLRAIHGFSEILLEDFAAQLPAEAKELLTSIHASGGRLRALIDDLLAFSRLGRSDLRKAEIDLEPMVRSVIAELVPEALAARVVIAFQPLGTCRGDASLVRAVWTNLIDNALKYSRTRERIEISIGAEEREGETVYFVEDNGVGFDPRYADRLFGMFQRLHSAREFEGTGVGLANVRRIVERHHGRVSATSQLDRGSRFEFTLGGEQG